MDGTLVKNMKKADKIMKTDWRVDKMCKISTIFDEYGKKELTSDDVMDEYRKKWGQIDDTVILDILKRMSSEGILHRERRSVKAYPSGHVKTVSRFFYRMVNPAKLDALDRKIMDDMRTVVEGKKAPSFDLVPEDMKGRPAFSTPTQLSPKERETEKMKAKIEKIKEMAEQPQKEEKEPKKVKADKTIDLLTTLTFDEALGKLYRGQKVVSAVSGNIYVMLPGKGITSTSNPGAIVTVFPVNEMEGKWRVVESPKACPFCGGAVKLVEFKNEYMYKCTNEECRTIGPHALTPEEAVNKFNKRC